MLAIFLINIIGGILLLISGRKIAASPAGKKYKVLITMGLLLLCVPALVIFLNDVIHVFPSVFVKSQSDSFNYPYWYIYLRSIRRMELVSLAVPLFVGFVTPVSEKNKVRWNILCKYIYFLSLFFILILYVDCIPAPSDAMTKETWHQGVCIQSTGYTCVPSSLATIMRYYGKNSTEKENAEELGTSVFGTNEWTLLTYARENGLKEDCFYVKSLDEIPVPSIFTVRVKGIAHAITLLGRENGNYIIGDPLVGRLILSEQKFKEKYKLKGFVFHIKGFGKG